MEHTKRKPYYKSVCEEFDPFLESVSTRMWKNTLHGWVKTLKLIYKDDQRVHYDVPLRVLIGSQQRADQAGRKRNSWRVHVCALCCNGPSLAPFAEHLVCVSSFGPNGHAALQCPTQAEPFPNAGDGYVLRFPWRRFVGSCSMMSAVRGVLCGLRSSRIPAAAMPMADDVRDPLLLARADRSELAHPTVRWADVCTTVRTRDGTAAASSMFIDRHSSICCVAVVSRAAGNEFQRARQAGTSERCIALQAECQADRRGVSRMVEALEEETRVRCWIMGSSCSNSIT